MPIYDLSDSVRLPRLGKIHLGVKVEKKDKDGNPVKNGRGEVITYPVKTDYFVLPKDHPNYKELVDVYGEKPKSLNILLPSEDMELWAPQYYKAYTQTHGIVCKGDARNAIRTIDVKTGKFPTQETQTVTREEIPCDGKNCPVYLAKKCHKSMNLRVILYDIPGLGVWQIDSTSGNSMRNILGCAKLISDIYKRFTCIPLKLTLEPGESVNPESGKKEKAYFIFIRENNKTLLQIATEARRQAGLLNVAPQKLTTEAELKAAFEAEVQDDIDTFWPSDETSKPDVIEVQPASDKDFDELESASSKAEPVKAETKPKKSKAKETTQPTRDISAIKTVNDLYKACNEDFGMQPRDVLDGLKVDSQSQIADLPSKCYLEIKKTKE